MKIMECLAEPCLNFNTCAEKFIDYLLLFLYKKYIIACCKIKQAPLLGENLRLML